METKDLPKVSSNPLGFFLRVHNPDGGQRQMNAEDLVWSEKQSLTAGVDCYFVIDASTENVIGESLLMGVDPLRSMITVKGAIYILDADFSINTWQTIATIAAGHRPNSVEYFPAVEFLDATKYSDNTLTDFSGSVEIPRGSIRVLPTGEIQFYCKGSVISFATISTSNYLIFPFSFNYFKNTETPL